MLSFVGEGHIDFFIERCDGVAVRHSGRKIDEQIRVIYLLF